MNEKIQATARHLVSMLVAGDYEDLEALSRGVRLNQAEMDRAVREYPGKLVMPPSQAILDLGVVEVTNSNPTQWRVDIRLRTEEEGESDYRI